MEKGEKSAFFGEKVEKKVEKSFHLCYNKTV